MLTTLAAMKMMPNVGGSKFKADKGQIIEDLSYLL